MNEASDTKVGNYKAMMISKKRSHRYSRTPAHYISVLASKSPSYIRARCISSKYIIPQRHIDKNQVLRRRDDDGIDPRGLRGGAHLKLLPGSSYFPEIERKREDDFFLTCRSRGFIGSAHRCVTLHIPDGDFVLFTRALIRERLI